LHSLPAPLEAKLMFQNFIEEIETVPNMRLPIIPREDNGSLSSVQVKLRSVLFHYFSVLL